MRPFSVIPADVELEPFVDAQYPNLVALLLLRLLSNKIVVVEPVGRRVVRVLEREAFAAVATSATRYIAPSQP